MIYKFHVNEISQATYTIEAKNRDIATAKAESGDYIDREVWDTNVANIIEIERINKNA